MSQSTNGDIMPLTITPERYQQVRTAVKQRRIEKLAAVITATNWNDQPQFADVDDFLKFLDAVAEPTNTDLPGSGNS
jgi:hypothetical protein